LRDNVGDKDLVFEPVHDNMLRSAALTLAPVNFHLKLRIVPACNLGLLEPLWAIEVPTTPGIPFGNSIGIGKILLG
jgi:hypothetical protein